MTQQMWVYVTEEDSEVKGKAAGFHLKRPVQLHKVTMVLRMTCGLQA